MIGQITRIVGNSCSVVNVLRIIFVSYIAAKHALLVRWRGCGKLPIFMFKEDDNLYRH